MYATLASLCLFYWRETATGSQQLAGRLLDCDSLPEEEDDFDECFSLL
jgi:hypothetical protein